MLNIETVSGNPDLLVHLINNLAGCSSCTCALTYQQGLAYTLAVELGQSVSFMQIQIPGGTMLPG
ncbi:hypothetical protein D3C72_2446530 [compost metagenome]